MLHPPVPESTNQERAPAAALAHKYNLRSRTVHQSTLTDCGTKSPEDAEHPFQ